MDFLQEFAVTKELRTMVLPILCLITHKEGLAEGLAEAVSLQGEVCITRGSKDSGEIFMLAVCAVFYNLFYHLEDSNLLDPTSILDLYALHFVYLPYINFAMKLFVDAWCDHPMRSCHNRTPNQLWISGMLNNSTSGNTVTNELYDGLDYVSAMINYSYASYLFLHDFRVPMVLIGKAQFQKNQIMVLKFQIYFALSPGKTNII